MIYDRAVMMGRTATTSDETRDRQLVSALAFNFVIHGLALVSMAALLLPMLPGGSGTSDAARVAAIAAHPFRFRLGWFPWQLCALADVLLATAMVRVRWMPRGGALFVLVLTLAAVVPDQYAQAVWVRRGVELAQTDVPAYFALERRIFPLTAGVGALLYTIAALGWTYCFVRARTWSRTLTMLSVPLWLTMIVAVGSPLLPEAIRPSAKFVSTANGFGFVQLQLWLALVTWAVWKRVRGAAPQ